MITQRTDGRNDSTRLTQHTIVISRTIVPGGARYLINGRIWTVETTRTWNLDTSLWTIETGLAPFWLYGPIGAERSIWARKRDSGPIVGAEITSWTWITPFDRPGSSFVFVSSRWTHVRLNNSLVAIVGDGTRVLRIVSRSWRWRILVISSNSDNIVWGLFGLKYHEP